MMQRSTGSPDGELSHAVSGDGARIAFRRFGAGRPLILIGGAFNDRDSMIAGGPMAALLAGDFAVFAYDRRGRGDSTDSLPFAVEREIDDLAALIAGAGEPAFLFGHSSGGALALEAAIAGLPVAGMAVYEPPYSETEAEEAESKAFVAELDRLLAAGDHAAAAQFWLVGTGAPEEMVDGMRGEPYWPGMVGMAPTLACDAAVMRHGGDSFVPAARIAGIGVPLLAMAGGDSPGFMRNAARRIAAAAPFGRHLEFAGENHMVSPKAVAPALRSFFASIGAAT